ncbi:biotin/lipoyl-binding protein [Biomaibacter acetigenes]|uniref:Biotin/lipoyl-binding protein n=1 Tax=Biomaibacter acetigenes TaxID=2316383 RepID=A0A3G2R6S9_9FIRM|nr:biotin/lipoyl-containing protein [Biomaibacter acetigenes]AYO30194.1 biotin/lipoyl-binding protein [Biomaibacter acetigenes]AYO30547.1 biotin/lipoyl-binding protein [Biomaibacter acetigenes]AYO31399.1 biotin/lipoyl-binding protein [Biomaibacter acetigenes]RKL61271.1 biotin/lipoyl-binding protein [Thermoanaerobacteraceae bacterium SP2]
MKKYKITVNGQTYEVEVEEIGGTGLVKEETPAPVATTEKPKEAPKQETPKPAPATAPAPKKAAPAGKATITAPMPGTILSVKVKEGSKVSKGDVIMILEAMKMENEILAPQDGIISSIDVSEGASVNTGDILATME